jgi:hypothetical protein
VDEEDQRRVGSVLLGTEQVELLPLAGAVGDVELGAIASRRAERRRVARPAARIAGCSGTRARLSYSVSRLAMPEPP